MESAVKQLAGVGVIGDLEGLCLSTSDNEVLNSSALAGIILFSRNYESPSQLKKLVASIRERRPAIPLFVDQEGGRVQRFREGFTRLPPMMTLAKLFEVDTGLAREAAQKLGWLMASELFDHGVDVSFAPVLDVDRGCSQVIGDRAFGLNPAIVSILAESFVLGMQRAGMPAVGKHFPGHGAVVADSHKALPVDDRSLSQLDYDMRPFRYLVEKHLLQGMMPAHVRFPAVDVHRTAGFSPLWTSLLRNSVGFDGVIFSDDLTMQGAAEAGSYSHRAELAIDAGCNALVVCNVPEGVREVLDRVERLHQQGLAPLDLGSWKVSCSVDHRELDSVRSWLKSNKIID